MSRYTLDQAGLELIRSFEGFVDGAYPDSEGFATCGVGHLLHRSAPTAVDHRTWDHKGWAFYSGLLAKDAQRVALGPMNELIHVPLNQHQVNATVSLCFNCGPAPLHGTFGRLLNTRQYRKAADAMLDWDTPAVLRPRREQERAVFLKPIVAGVPMPWLTVNERRWCGEYDKLKATGKDKDRRRVLRRVMAAEAAKISYAAKHEGGWERAHRRQRWHSLTARSS